MAVRRAAPNFARPLPPSTRMLQAGQHTERQELIIACQPTTAAARSQLASPTAHAAAGGHAGAHAAAGRAIRRRKRLPAHALTSRRSPARTSGGNSASGGRCRESPAAAASVARHCGGSPQRNHPIGRSSCPGMHTMHTRGFDVQGASGAAVGSAAGLAELRAPWRCRAVARASCPGLGEPESMCPHSARAERRLPGPGRHVQRLMGRQRKAAAGAARAATKAPCWAVMKHSAVPVRRTAAPVVVVMGKGRRTPLALSAATSAAQFKGIDGVFSPSSESPAIGQSAA